MVIILIFFIFTSFHVSIESSRVLGIPHLDHASHSFVFLKLARELIHRGYDYTHVLPNNFSTKLPIDGIQVITYKTKITSTEHDQIVPEPFLKIKYGLDPVAIEAARILGEVHSDMYAQMLDDKDFISTVKQLNPSLLMCDTLFQGCAILSDMLQIPRIDIMTGGFHDPFISDFYGIPQSSLYLTPAMHPRDNKFSLFNRLKKTLSALSYRLAIQPSIDFTSLWKKSVGKNTTFEKYEDLLRTVGIVLMTVDFAVEEPRPLNPNMKVIGSVSSQSDTKPLPEKFEKLMNANKNGVVLVSLGTLWYPFNEDFIQNLADGLAELPYKVLWKHTCKQPKRIGRNTHIMSWVPQNDMLAHRATKLFITHGGPNSVFESVFHKVPMVVISLAGDQHVHGEVVEMREIGHLLNKFTMKAEDIVKTVNKIMTNEKYQRNIERISKLMTDRPRTPTQEGADWIEYALRNNGALHLYNPGTDVPMYQQCMLDILLLLFAVVFSCSYFLVVMAKCVLKAVKNNKEKEE